MVVEGVLVVMVMVFFSSALIVLGIGKDEEREEEEEEFFRDKEIFESKSLSDAVKIVGFVFVDDDSEELSSDETSNGSKVSEPNVA